MTKTSIKTGWCEDGLIITPEDTWNCSTCGKHVSLDDQKTKGGWFDYNNNGKLGFIHFDCYIYEHTLKKDIETKANETEHSAHYKNKIVK